MILFSYVKLPGAVRHHGFLWVFWVTTLWWAIDTGALTRKRATVLLMPTIVAGLIGAVIAGWWDWREPFSAAKSVSEQIREQGLDGLPLVGGCDFAASGVAASTYAQHADTVSFCFSKGLGAPVGSMLVGDAETMDRAHRFRKMLGGGMRQAGVLAAAASYALDHHLDRLAEDHARAARFRQALEGDFTFPMPSPTNMVYLDVPDAPAFVERLARLGVLAFSTGPSRVRTVFHLDVSDDGVELAIDAFRQAAR